MKKSKTFREVAFISKEDLKEIMKRLQGFKLKGIKQTKGGFLGLLIKHGLIATSPVKTENILRNGGEND